MWRASFVLLFACKTNSLLDSELKGSEPKQGGYCHNLNLYTKTELTGATTSPKRPTNTFSIVARDPVTGDLGVAVQSHWFNVGGVVTWAEPGVGAIATQSFAEPMYGAKGLALMREGVSGPDAMARLLMQDKGAATRQLGFIDAKGRVESFTGEQCIGVASSYVGDQFAVQANIMANDLVVPAMAHAFEAAKGDLTDRLLAALDAGQEVGGDIRGCQSAAILVVSGKKSDTPWLEKKIDLRVEDHASPIVELHRLVGLARAYQQMNKGDERMEQGDIEGAAAAYEAATKQYPNNVEMMFWQGATWAGVGKLDRAAPLLKQAFQEDPAWIELLRRLPAAKLLPSADVAEQAIGAAQK